MFNFIIIIITIIIILLFFNFHKKSKYNIFTRLYKNFGITFFVYVFIQKYQVDLIIFLFSILFQFFIKYAILFFFVKFFESNQCFFIKI